MEKNNNMLNIIAVIIIAIIFFIIGYVVKQKEINNDKYIINKPDTVYNRIVIDSLKYNIIKMYIQKKKGVF